MELANALRTLGEHETALALYREAIASWDAADYDHPRVGVALTALASCASVVGEYDAAAAALERSTALALRFEGEDSVSYGNALAGQGAQALRLGQAERAVEFYESAVAVLEPAGDELALAIVRLNLGAVLKSAGRPQAAVELLEPAMAVLAEWLEPTDPRIANGRGHLAGVYRDLERPSDAARELAAYLEVRWSLRPDPPTQTADLIGAVGNFHVDAGEFEAAEAELVRAFEIARDEVGRDSEIYATAERNLRFLIEAWDDDEARTRIAALIAGD